VRVGLDFHDLFVMPPQSVLPTTHIMLLVVVSMMWFSVFSSGNLVFQHHMCSGSNPYPGQRLFLHHPSYLCAHPKAPPPEVLEYPQAPSPTDSKASHVVGNIFNIVREGDMPTYPPTSPCRKTTLHHSPVQTTAQMYDPTETCCLSIAESARGYSTPATPPF